MKIPDEMSHKLAEIRRAAQEVHDRVNQHYDSTLPYGFHLDMVADAVTRHADEVLASPDDLLPLMFGAFFHDSIEDARLTYRDLLVVAKRFFGDEQALMATEIAYALTNEKGRNRAERANDRYYEGIRSTPYAPMVKLADRIANMTYSAHHTNDTNAYMRGVYAAELPHFLESITVAEPADKRFSLPQSMIDEVLALAATASDNQPH